MYHKPTHTKEYKTPLGRSSYYTKTHTGLYRSLFNEGHLYYLHKRDGSPAVELVTDEKARPIRVIPVFHGSNIPLYFTDTALTHRRIDFYWVFDCKAHKVPECEFTKKFGFPGDNLDRLRMLTSKDYNCAGGFKFTVHFEESQYNMVVVPSDGWKIHLKHS